MGHFDAIPVTKSDELLGDLPHSHGSGSGPSCIDKAKLRVEKLKPATMSHQPTSKASDESELSVIKENRHRASSVG